MRGMAPGFRLRLSCPGALPYQPFHAACPALYACCALTPCSTRRSSDGVRLGSGSGRRSIRGRPSAMGASTQDRPRSPGLPMAAVRSASGGGVDRGVRRARGVHGGVGAAPGAGRRGPSCGFARRGGGPAGRGVDGARPRTPGTGHRRTARTVLREPEGTGHRGRSGTFRRRCGRTAGGGGSGVRRARPRAAGQEPLHPRHLPARPVLRRLGARQPGCHHLPAGVRSLTPGGARGVRRRGSGGHRERSGTRQSIGSCPWAFSASSIRPNGLLPRKSLADSGEGCAPSMTVCREVSISGSFLRA